MKHKTAIQIRFKDIDALGHVNHANHLTYFELARINYFRDVVGEELDWNEAGIIIAQATIDYKQPIYPYDKIFIYTKFLKKGTTSFELGYELIREEKEDNEILLATGTTVIVCYSYENKKPTAIPETWIKKMEL